MERIYVVMRESLEILAGEDWGRTSSTPVDHLERVAVHPDEPNRVFLGSMGEGLHRSVDGGETVERVGADRLGSRITSIAIDPREPDHVLAGTEPSAVYRSTDGGDTWGEIPGLAEVPSAGEWSFPPRPDTHHVRWLEIDPTDGDRWYVGIEAGALLVTPDGGETWIDRPPGSRRDNHTLTTHSAAPGRVYSAAGDGYAESTDGGEHWTTMMEGLEHRYVWGLAVDPEDPDVRLASAAHGASGAHRMPTADSHLYRRGPDGPWSELRDTDFPTGAGTLRAALASGTAGGEFVAATNRGVFSSIDAGDTWVELTDNWTREYGESTVRAIEVC